MSSNLHCSELEVNSSAFFSLTFKENNMIIERRVDFIYGMWKTSAPSQSEKGAFQLFHPHRLKYSIIWAPLTTLFFTYMH